VTSNEDHEYRMPRVEETGKKKNSFICSVKWMKCSLV
jgi:hypothetical protein